MDVRHREPETGYDANIRFRGDDQLDTRFTDRGQSFYALKSGRITKDYSHALRAHSLTSFMGDDASRQPGGLKDLMLHETAVAWLTDRLKVTVPAKPWDGRSWGRSGVYPGRSAPLRLT